MIEKIQTDRQRERQKERKKERERESETERFNNKRELHSQPNDMWELPRFHEILDMNTAVNQTLHLDKQEPNVHYKRTQAEVKAHVPP